MFDSNKIKDEFNSQISQTLSIEDLLSLKSAMLGKTGVVSKLFHSLSNLDTSEKKNAGRDINNLKNYIETKISEKKSVIELSLLKNRLSQESVDISLPSRNINFGSIHPISFVLDEITSIFNDMGFITTSGPEVEQSHYNFNALNIPDHHPAREMHDTFYIDVPDYLMRTHTSSVQIRSMLNNNPPLKIVSPGRTFRSDSDATHTPMFHQVEALYIDRNVNFAELRYCINEFLRRFFECDVNTRFRTSYFPFTEPSAEVDISCAIEDNHISIGKGDKFLEIMGCGMVHSNVLKNCNIDFDEFQGFALGLGVERLAMLKYGMSDLREFFQNDPRFLKHYSFFS